MNDGYYDSITREDETNLKIVTKEVKIDYSQLKECSVDYDGKKYNGIICQDTRIFADDQFSSSNFTSRCYDYNLWCRPGARMSCKIGETQIRKTFNEILLDFSKTKWFKIFSRKSDSTIANVCLFVH